MTAPFAIRILMGLVSVIVQFLLVVGFLVSCSGFAVIAGKVEADAGAQHYQAGDKVSPMFPVVIEVSQQETVASAEFRLARLGHMDQLEKRYPRHTFLLPTNSGHTSFSDPQEDRGEFRVIESSSDRQLIELEMRTDRPFVFHETSRYEVTGRVITPKYFRTQGLSPLGLLGGFVASCSLLFVVGWLCRRRLQSIDRDSSQKRLSAFAAAARLAVLHLFPSQRVLR